MAERAQDDADLVRSEYADETGLTVRFALWERPGVPQPAAAAYEAVLEAAPRRLLEVGCGRGELAERLQRAGVEVVALDQSERMVELTRARGVDARVGDVRSLPFAEGEFDAVVANHMLYHVPEVDRALAELARVLRPGGRLVASTNGVGSLAEMWALVGRDLSPRRRLFMRETGEELLRRHFADVRAIELDGSLELTADEIRRYIAHSVAHKHLVPRVPDFEGTMQVTASAAVFVAEKP